MKIVLATSNRDKIKEIRRILSGLNVELVALDTFAGLDLPE